ncbi:uncharacterized protein RSE6_11689 [Rhynchosporium secalis]|uniref:PARP-type domain-containing protein n=1 Tax=Rhynchosporium secalis TaxID=38038 RepID=A0A1E1MNK5_RHYSE|nr:uncharacterized protein RSE6_11689 [Rhynchosporium secalis]
MSYRVEIALSGRSGCHSTECKDAKIKIDKGELRLGVWVEFPTGGGWVYRHWGCVTGKILENIRKSIEVPGEPGQYQWDMLDGYDSGDKNSLDKDPKLQEKVRRCITQGFIDPEDWNGDPEMNVLGASGMRTKESMKKAREDQKARTKEIDDLKAQIAALQAEKADGAGSKLDAKVAAAQADLEQRIAADLPVESLAAAKKRIKDEAAAEEGAPPKKKRATKKKVKAEVDDDEDEDVKPAKKASKSRAKKVKREETDDEEIEEETKAPAKRSRGKQAVKKEEDDNDDDAEDQKPVPAKKSRAKKAVKKEEDTEMTGKADKPTGIKKEETEESAPKQAPKKRAPAKKKAAKAKEEVDEDAESAIKIEEREDDEEKAKTTSKKRAPRGKKTVKAGEAVNVVGVEEDSPKAGPAAKKGREKANKGENVEDGVKEEPTNESSSPGITEGSSVLSDPQDLTEGVKDEPIESVGVAPETEEANAAAPADEVKNLVVPTHGRRTRSRTASKKA